MDSEGKAKIGAPLLIVLVVALAGIGGWWYWASQPRTPAEPPPLTPEAKAYVRNLQLAEVQMKATENFAGAAVVEILGKITNAGDRTLDRVELTCIFYDTSAQVALRERLPIVKSTLKPGETREFRLPFEGLPPNWNQAMPQLVIAHISFQ